MTQNKDLLYVARRIDEGKLFEIQEEAHDLEGTVEQQLSVRGISSRKSQDYIWGTSGYAWGIFGYQSVTGLDGSPVESDFYLKDN